MLLSDMKRKRSLWGRTETRISFQGEISQLGKDKTGPQDQKYYGKRTSRQYSQRYLDSAFSLRRSVAELKDQYYVYTWIKVSEE